MADRWLDIYEHGHSGPVNRALHWICAPLLVCSLVGILWALPVPAAFRASDSVINWGTLFIMAIIVYYFIISIRLAIGSLPFIVFIALVIARLDMLATPLWKISVLALAISALGLYTGHQLDGNRTSVLRDLLYAPIAPLWILGSLYRQLGIRY